ncbi:MAG TPA: ABC transporter ATP-binding protein [Polyangia bacterium]|jgi:ATP-binding cassette subfamily B protein
MMPAELAPFVWSADRAGEATRALALAARLIPRAGAIPSTPVAEVARALEIEAEAYDIGCQTRWRESLRVGPSLLSLAGGRGTLAVLRVGTSQATLIGPNGRARVALDALEDVLWSPLDDDPALGLRAVEERLHHALPDRRRSATIRAARLLVAGRCASRVLAEAWTLRATTSTLRSDLARVQVPRRALAIVAAYGAEFVLFLGIWRQVGRRALAAGAGSGAGLLALLLLWAGLQLLAATAVRRLALDVGAVVRVWLLRGALRLDPEHIRDAGVGQLLGRALDAEALDALALGGGVEALAGLFEFGSGAAVLALGVAPTLLLGTLTVAVALLVLGARAQLRRHAAWSETRRALTHDLVERMVGYRTLLVQDRPERRAIDDDRALAAYEARTGRLDRLATWLDLGLPRLFLMLALGAVGASLWRTAAIATAAVATSIGGIWLAYAGLRRLGTALGELIAAREAWSRVRPLVAAPAEAAPRDGAEDIAPSGDRPPLISVRGVGYQYPQRRHAQLAAEALTIEAGDRLLVSGPSGAGKSTLAAILVGLKAPTTGRLLLRGRDQRALGLDRWRRAVGAVPQFHENHVFSADLLFNLLMGRRWPPRAEDIVLAETVCRELGLGALLERMPGGLLQVVGETGWQLSHGERSRLYIARSLLQTLDARVLDESFAALDPETLDEVMAAVLRRPEALVVIAHP